MPEQSIQFASLKPGSLEGALGFSAPLFHPKEMALRQLRYIEDYADQIKCKCFAVEARYIDRDFMEDYSVFYSKCFVGYPNSCRRVHFFSMDEEEVRKAIGMVVASGNEGDAAYHEACRRLSEDAYLGFCVIKPLDGSPVGRTVLKCFPPEPGDSRKFVRHFNCTRRYVSHFLGVEFSLRGLGFQQQDIGVSACATTAVWSALQKVRDHQHIAAFTPAQITALASKYSLPFGRSMPSEGLSIDQMCQAVQAMGVSPNVYRADQIREARGYLYSAIKSGFPPILILGKGEGKHSGDFHAVAVVGMKLSSTRDPGNIDPLSDDRCNDLVGIYIHDDRRGPYLRASLQPKDHVAQIHIDVDREGKRDRDIWDLKHIIIPTPSKIRIAMAGLRESSLHLVKTLHSIRELIEKRFNAEVSRSISYEYWIERSHKYIENIIVNPNGDSRALVQKICSSIPMSRHIGVASVAGGFFDPIDLLLDVTGTQRNAHCLGVCAKSTHEPLTRYVIADLARQYRCQGVF